MYKNEIWKPINGYDGMYEISNLGNVKSLARAYTRVYKKQNKINEVCMKEKLLTPFIGKRGYVTVDLSKDKQRTHKYIHQLIAVAFIPNPNNYTVINHKDGRKLNNSIDNLEWCTDKMNKQHASDMGLLKMKPVNQYSLDGEFIKRWKSCADIHKVMGFVFQNISKCCYGERQTAHGYKWKFAENE